MDIGYDDCFRMEVQHSGAEGADHEPVGFKGLMDRRRHVVLASDRLEVHDVKCNRIDKAVPSDDIKGMVITAHDGVPIKIEDVNATGLMGKPGSLNHTLNVGCAALIIGIGTIIVIGFMMGGCR